jgi:hypothetical protein
VEQLEVTRLLAQDVAATLGQDHVSIVTELAAQIHGWIGDDPDRFESTLVEEVQQDFHDTFVDTSWPACPRHPNHPMWYEHGYWCCTRDQVAIAKLGELRPVVEARG